MRKINVELTERELVMLLSELPISIKDKLYLPKNYKEAYRSVVEKLMKAIREMRDLDKQ